MFTGLIEGTGTLRRLEHHGPDAQMVIQANTRMERILLGESIAVDGACLTVVSFHGNVFTVDVSAETLHRTTLGRKPAGSQLNLERALRMGDRLGGHMVSGHVDGIGTLKDRTAEGRSWRLFFHVPRELTRYIIEKGSIAVNGISLTVNGCGDTHFDVNIVPHTAGETTISQMHVGDAVNIETDLIGKYVEKMVAAWGGQGSAVKDKANVDVNFLKEHGFL